MPRLDQPANCKLSTTCTTCLQLSLLQLLLLIAESKSILQDQQPVTKST